MAQVNSVFHQQFLYFKNKYYEEHDNYIPENIEFLSTVEDLIKDTSYIISRKNVWNYVSLNNHDLPLQGWKIHISATPFNNKEILSVAAKYLIEQNIPFKFLIDQIAFKKMNSKIANRGSAGKFITVYPWDLDSFKEIIEGLYIVLKNFDGPYILSDNRYKDSKVLYYRYGGIKANIEVNYRGEQELVLVSPNGHTIPDGRNPYFDTPYWEEDPFSTLTPTEDDSELLNNRFEVIDVIQFSVSGGVYTAMDHETNRKVVIKEARPFTSFDKSLDSVARLKKEKTIYKKLSKYKLSPAYITDFYEWEHYYLVMEFFEGEDLSSFINLNNPLFSLKGDVNLYLQKLKNVWLEIAYALKTFHAESIVFGDLSTNNIMINDNDQKWHVNLIDFEGSWLIGNEPSELTTAGFTPPPFNGHLDYSPKRDVYSLGAVMISTLFPLNNLYNLSKVAGLKAIRNLFNDLNVSTEIQVLIKNMLDLNPENRPSTLEVIKMLEDTPITREDNLHEKTPQSLSSKDLKDKSHLINEKILNKVEQLNNHYIFKTDPITFISNPLNVSYGSFGILHVLNYCKTPIPKEIDEWVRTLEISPKDYPPGLYMGLSGIAWVMFDIGHIEKAEAILTQALNHPNINKSSSIYYGHAGIGMTCIKAYLRTNNVHWLNRAIEIGKTLIEQKQNARKNNKTTCYWEDPEENIWTTYTKGNSGIATFLMYIYQITAESVFLETATEAIEFDIHHLHRDVKFLRVSRNSVDADQSVYSHYWKDGTAGLLLGISRLWYITKNQEYKNIIDGLVEDITRKYTFMPNLFSGLSGLCNTLIDLYQFTREKKYLDKIEFVVSGIENFELIENDSIEFPGEQNFRISHDFGTGSAGISALYYRLSNVENNLNFNFMLDELLNQDCENGLSVEGVLINER